MAYRTIDVLGLGLQKQGQADTLIMPGMLVAKASDGDLDPHGTALGTTAKAFAVENELEGQDIDTAYAIGDTVQYKVFPPGAEVMARLPASASAIVIGDFVDSNGDGYVRLVATAAATADISRNSVVGIAQEAVDNSSGGAGTLIRIEIL